MGIGSLKIPLAQCSFIQLGLWLPHRPPLRAEVFCFDAWVGLFVYWMRFNLGPVQNWTLVMCLLSSLKEQELSAR